MSSCSYQPPTEYQQACELADQRAWDAMTPEQQRAQVAEQIATRRSAAQQQFEAAMAQAVKHTATPNKRLIDAGWECQWDYETGLPKYRLPGDDVWRGEKLTLRLQDAREGIVAAKAPKTKADKTRFSKFEYQAAKAFLKDAEVVSGFSTPSVATTTYRKPDGSMWCEYDSKLEAPEDDYSLELKTVAPELREWRIEYWTMSDGHATMTVRAENETAARRIVNAMPDCSQVIGGVR